MAFDSLVNGDLFGFIVEQFTGPMGNNGAEIFYGLLAFVVTGVMYIRYNDIMVPAIVWVIIGSIAVASMQIVSPFAVLFLTLGLGGLLYRLFTSLR